MNTQAYLLWEKAGRPDGADFAQDARATLEAQLRSGKSVQDIEAALKAPEPKVTCPSCLSYKDGFALVIDSSADTMRNMAGPVIA